MDPKLIRNIPDSSTISKDEQYVQTIDNKRILLPRPLSLSLLRNDRSALTTNEWTLLSNFLHAFDQQNAFTRIQYSLAELSSLPPKLRLKLSEVTNVLRELFSNVGPIIERSPDFHSLPVDTRQLLINHNLFVTGAVNAFFLCREVDIFHNMTAFNASNQLYGSELIAECRRNIAQYDSNGSLIKIFIFILAFSSSCSIVKYDNQVNITIMSSSINLVRIQNVYATMLWKYLVYLYGFKEAVPRFTRLVKNVLDLIRILTWVTPNETRDLVVDSIVTETGRALVIAD
ncbi:unnamed protein product [Rotaria sp. Silwood2]|nr:unnamed protein product [Rotaria sp. Silwood2]